MEIDRETGEVLSPFVRSAYNYDMDAASLETGVDASVEALDPEQKQRQAQQQFKEETDINTIVRRFGLTGQLPENLKVPQYADYTEQVTDFQSALNMVLKAQDSFMELPAETRARFGNDPQRLLEFVDNKDNLEEARKLGIAVPAPAPEPPPRVIDVRVIPDEPAAK